MILSLVFVKSVSLVHWNVNTSMILIVKISATIDARLLSSSESKIPSLASNKLAKESSIAGWMIEIVIILYLVLKTIHTY